MFIVNCLLLLYGNRLNCIKFSTEFTKFEAKFSLLSTWVWGGFLSGFAVFRWVYPQKSTGYFGYLPGYPNPKSKWRLFGLSLGWFFVRFLPFLGEFTPQKPTGCFEYLPGYQNPESKWRLFDFARFFCTNLYIVIIVPQALGAGRSNCSPWWDETRRPGNGQATPPCRRMSPTTTGPASRLHLQSPAYHTEQLAVSQGFTKYLTINLGKS